MKRLRLLTSAVLAAALSGMAVGPTVADPVIGGLVAAPAAVPETVAGTNAIRLAQDPSTAIAAYAAAQAAQPGNLDVERTFVQRMVDFGLPEMAETQARDLVVHDAQSGLGWGVVGYMSAKRGQTAEAIMQLGIAAKYLPEEAFVQRTAAQALAWYDTRADKTQMADVQTRAEALRTALAGKAAFAAAYSAAAEADAKVAATPATQAAGAVTTSDALTSGTPDYQAVGGVPYTPPAVAPVYAAPADNTYSPYFPYDSYGNPLYTNPYAVVGEPCAPWCPSPCLGGPAWWPVLPVFVGGGGRRGEFFHHEPDRDGRGLAGGFDRDAWPHTWNGAAGGGAVMAGHEGGSLIHPQVFAAPAGVMPAGPRPSAVDPPVRSAVEAPAAVRVVPGIEAPMVARPMPFVPEERPTGPRIYAPRPAVRYAAPAVHYSAPAVHYSAPAAHSAAPHYAAPAGGRRR